MRIAVFVLLMCSTCCFGQYYAHPYYQHNGIIYNNGGGVIGRVGSDPALRGSLQQYRLGRVDTGRAIATSRYKARIEYFDRQIAVKRAEQNYVQKLKELNKRQKPIYSGSSYFMVDGVQYSNYEEFKNSDQYDSWKKNNAGGVSGRRLFLEPD